MSYFWKQHDIGNQLKAQRLREIEDSMAAYIDQKKTTADETMIQSVKEARAKVSTISSFE